MPAKYLILKSISCNITNLRLASEEELWEEHRELMETFLKRWKEIRSGAVDIISDLARQRTSLMDLNVELVNRMLTLQLLSLELSGRPIYPWKWGCKNNK
jgi:putative pyruvate formate lyase activating enzyme